MVKLTAFIFGTVMHLYWGCLQERNYASINNIHKIMNFLKISHFALFGSFGIHVKDTNFTFGTPHTHTYMYRYTQTHADIQTQIQVPFSHFVLSGSFSIHSKDIWHTTDLHMHRHIETQIQIHWDTCMFVYMHKHTHRCACGKSMEIVTWSLWVHSQWASESV